MNTCEIIESYDRKDLVLNALKRTNALSRGMRLCMHGNTVKFIVALDDEELQNVNAALIA